MNDTSPPSKSALRQRFRAYRAELSDEEYARKSAAILRHVGQHPELHEAGTVHMYWPLVDEREVDTRPLIRSLRRRGADVVLPVITCFVDGENGSPAMEHRRYTGPDCLQANRWGVYEPVRTELVSPAALDLVIVPALGADRTGHRIGHGYGYYDAFLRAVDVPTVALVYAACLVETVPVEPHDIAVDYVATEDEMIATCSEPASP